MVSGNARDSARIQDLFFNILQLSTTSGWRRESLEDKVMAIQSDEIPVPLGASSETGEGSLAGDIQKWRQHHDDEAALIGDIGPMEFPAS